MVFLILLCKILSKVSRWLNLGGGGTWPGELLLKLYPSALNYFLSRFDKGVIIVAGTNGKTTTSSLIKQIIVEDEKHAKDPSVVVHNHTGANLVNGIVSACIMHSPWIKNPCFSWGIFEVDEAVLPHIASAIHDYTKSVSVVLLNLFRDQLDRYGEVDAIAVKWDKALKDFPKQTNLIINADDPLLAYLGLNSHKKTIYFGLDHKDRYLKLSEHATDSIYCPKCGARLTYSGLYYSHLGVWVCDTCGFKRPEPDVSNIKLPIPGLYNEYNASAAVAVVRTLWVDKAIIQKMLDSFSPAFGRMETFEYQGKHVRLLLSKNPAGFNASIRTVIDLDSKTILFCLNDRIPDGRDVSWIWDVDFEMVPETVSIVASGDRAYDMGLRLKYAEKSQNPALKFNIYENLTEGIHHGLKLLPKNETLYILATYSAMLEARKLLIGRKLI